MEQQTATAKAEQARAEHELQDVRMRLDHTQAVYDEVSEKFAWSDPLPQIVGALMPRKATRTRPLRRRRRSEKADRVTIQCRLRLDTERRRERG